MLQKTNYVAKGLNSFSRVFPKFSPLLYIVEVKMEIVSFFSTFVYKDEISKLTIKLFPSNHRDLSCSKNSYELWKVY